MALLGSVVTCWMVIVLVLVRVAASAMAWLADPGPPRAEDAVALLAGAAGLLIAAWLAVATLARVLDAIRPRTWLGRTAGRLGARFAPASLRRAVLVAVGIGLVGTTPAAAAEPTRPPAAGPVVVATARIAAEWPRWDATNRTAIGPDPDLLRPGQSLRPPGRAAEPHRAEDHDRATVRPGGLP